MLGDEEGFFCDDNAPIIVNGKNECAFVIVTKHRVSTDIDPTAYEIFEMSLKYSGLNISTGLALDEQVIVGKVYTSPNSYFGNNTISGTTEMTFTKLDRNKRQLSLSFVFTGKSTYNGTSKDYNVSGIFTDVSY